MANDGTYNPSRVVLNVGAPAGIGGIPIALPAVPAGVVIPISIASGRGPDSQLAAARTSDTYTMTVGVDGDATHNRSQDKTGNMTLVLTHGSGFNSSLSFLQLLQEDEAVPDFTVEVSITDLNSTPPSVMYGQNCKISRPPDFERGATDGTNTWIFLPTDLRMAHAGRLA